MIVVLGHDGDVVGRRVYLELVKIRASCKWFDIDKLGVSYFLDERGFYWQGGSLAFDNVVSVYNRILSISFREKMIPMWSHLMWWLEEEAQLVLNRPQVVFIAAPVLLNQLVQSHLE